MATSLLSDAQLQSIKKVLANVFFTFAKESVVIRKRSVTLNSANFGESVSATPADFTIPAIYGYTTAKDGKYDIVQRSDKGLEEHDGFRLYIWKDDMTAQSLSYIAADADHVVFKGKEYVIDFAAPSAQFGTLGDLLWEVEIRFRH